MSLNFIQATGPVVLRWCLDQRINHPSSEAELGLVLECLVFLGKSSYSSSLVGDQITENLCDLILIGNLLDIQSTTLVLGARLLISRERKYFYTAAL